MGLFVYFSGKFECVRCRQISDTAFQTKLLRHDRDNFAQQYRIGDSEVLDGLDDYSPLHPWDGQTPLIVAVGDWECKNCGLSLQWVKAVFSVEEVAGILVATIKELSDLQPFEPQQLAGIHFIEEYLARLSGLWDPPVRYGPSGELSRWEECPIPKRCELVASGFRSWCREVAGLDTSV